MAHGSLQPQAKLSPLAVIVNPANPMTHASISQLAAIFTQPMRQLVATHWNQAGVKGDLATQAIAPCGLPWTDHYPSEDIAFGDDVFVAKFANAPPVPNYTIFKTYAEVAQYVAATPAAIGIIALDQVTPGVKVIGITDSPLGKPQTGTADQIAAGHYPLDRFLYINVHAVSGKPLDPFVLEYLRMVLSPEGQRAIAQEGEGYIPLSPLEAQNELAKLQ
jgi:phosphate transport system substrate-binding protein